MVRCPRRSGDDTGFNADPTASVSIFIFLLLFLVYDSLISYSSSVSSFSSSSSPTSSHNLYPFPLSHPAWSSLHSLPASSHSSVPVLLLLIFLLLIFLSLLLILFFFRRLLLLPFLISSPSYPRLLLIPTRLWPLTSHCDCIIFFCFAYCCPLPSVTLPACWCPLYLILPLSNPLSSFTMYIACSLHHSSSPVYPPPSLTAYSLPTSSPWTFNLYGFLLPEFFSSSFSSSSSFLNLRPVSSATPVLLYFILCVLLCPILLVFLGLCLLTQSLMCRWIIRFQ